MIHSTPSGVWQVVCRPFINYAVALFLFLSGYLTKLENKNWTAFYKKRITRVIIPYIIWTVIYTLPSIDSMSLNGIIILMKNLITTKATATLYYIFVYIEFVLLTPLLGKLIHSRFRWIGWLISPISVIIFKYFPLITRLQPNGHITTVWNVCFLGWFTFYYLGLILGNGILQINYNIKWLIALYIVSLPIQMIEGYGWLQLGDSNCGTQIKLSVYLTNALFLLIAYNYLKNEKMTGKVKWLVLIGDCSFGIYLSHIAIIMVLEKIPYYSEIPYIVNSIIILCLSLVLVIVGRKIVGKKISKWIGFM